MQSLIAIGEHVWRSGQILFYVIQQQTLLIEHNILYDYSIALLS